MRAMKIAVVGIALAFGAAFLLEGSGAAQNQKKDDQKQEQKTGEKKTVRVVIGKLTVYDTNKDGAAWDINEGKPDLAVRVTNMSDNTQKPVITSEKTDTFEATFDEKTVLVAEGQMLKIEVLDRDVAADDTIGLTQFQISGDMLKATKHDLTFERVKLLSLSFQNN